MRFVNSTTIFQIPVICDSPSPRKASAKKALLPNLADPLMLIKCKLVNLLGHIRATSCWSNVSLFARAFARPVGSSTYASQTGPQFLTSSNRLDTQSTTLREAWGYCPRQDLNPQPFAPLSRILPPWILQHVRQLERTTVFDVIQSTSHSVHHPSRRRNVSCPRQDSNPFNSQCPVSTAVGSSVHARA